VARSGACSVCVWGGVQGGRSPGLALALPGTDSAGRKSGARRRRATVAGCATGAGCHNERVHGERHGGGEPRARVGGRTAGGAAGRRRRRCEGRAAAGGGGRRPAAMRALKARSGRPVRRALGDRGGGLRTGGGRVCASSHCPRPAASRHPLARGRARAAIRGRATRTRSLGRPTRAFGCWQRRQRVMARAELGNPTSELLSRALLALLRARRSCSHSHPLARIQASRPAHGAAAANNCSVPEHKIQTALSRTPRLSPPSPPRIRGRRSLS